MATRTRTKKSRPLHRFTCPLCPYITKQNHHLNLHISYIHTKEKPHKCSYPSCTATFVSTSGLKSHQQVHTQEKKFECPICLKKFCSKLYIAEHMAIHDPIKKISCPHCPFKAKQRMGLQNHLKRMHRPDRQFTCSHCPYSTKTTRDLKNHLQTHLSPSAKEAAKKYMCPHCPYKTMLPASLRYHIGRRHGDEEREKKFKCSLCEYSTFTNSQLNTHSRTHTSEKPFRCSAPDCDAAFSIHSNLTRHQKCVHEKRRDFQCEICQKKFDAQSHLQRHTKSHETAKPFKCPQSQCDFKAAQNEFVLGHLRNVHGMAKPFKCQNCSVRMSTRSKLRQHALTFHSEMGQNAKKHKCPHDGCQYKSWVAHHMTLHIRTHTGHKPCKCSLCDYRTGYPGNLKLHMKSRHRENDAEQKKIKCQFCTFSSATMGNLNRHIRSHTGEKPFRCQVKGCKFSAANSSQVKSHQKWIHSTGQFLYRCDHFECTFKTKSRAGLNKHFQNEHQPSKTAKVLACEKEKSKISKINEIVCHNCNVEGCQFSTRNEKKLARHFSTRHQLPRIRLTRILV